MKFKTFGLAAIAALTIAGCGQQQNQNDASQREELVETTVIRKQQITRVLDFSTNIEGYQTVNVAPSIQGRIEHIYTEVGTNVSKGQMLLLMDQNQYNNTKLTFANLEVELSRIEALQESGAISKQTYDKTKLSYDQTKESLEYLEKNTFVRAQFDGVISAKNYEDGELYGGQPVLVLTQINKLKALISVPESYFPQVKKGMKVEIFSDIYPGVTFPASIEVIYPTVDKSSHTFQVKLVVPNPTLKLRPGMYVHTKLSMGLDKALIIPYNAVQKLTGSNDRYIYINEGGFAKRIFVQTGARYDENIEIISDQVKEGDALVTLGQARIVDGSKLKVTKEN